MKYLFSFVNLRRWKIENRARYGLRILLSTNLLRSYTRVKGVYGHAEKLGKDPTQQYNLMSDNKRAFQI